MSLAGGGSSGPGLGLKGSLHTQNLPVAQLHLVLDTRTLWPRGVTETSLTPSPGQDAMGVCPSWELREQEVGSSRASVGKGLSCSIRRSPSCLARRDLNLPLGPAHRVKERSAPPTKREWTHVCRGSWTWKSSISAILIPWHMETSRLFSCLHSLLMAISVLKRRQVRDLSPQDSPFLPA